MTEQARHRDGKFAAHTHGEPSDATLTPRYASDPDAMWELPAGTKALASTGEILTLRHTENDRCWNDAQGRIHNPDGPARILANGTHMHYEIGMLHNEFGPAIRWENEGSEHADPADKERYGLARNMVPLAPGSHSYYRNGWFVKATDPRGRRITEQGERVHP